MRTAILGFLLVIVASAAAVSFLPGNTFGICVEACSNSFIIRAARQLRACPAGFQCASNGCGHTCQAIIG